MGHSEPNPVSVQNVPTKIEHTTIPPPRNLREGNIDDKVLTKAWVDFADTLKKEDARLFSMLTSHTPALEGETKIIFQISNPLQKEPLLKIHPRLLKYLKTELNNDKVEIEIVLAEKNETTKAYTAEDKFAQMSRKNPSLLTFQRQFILDFE